MFRRVRKQDVLSQMKQDCSALRVLISHGTYPCCQAMYKYFDHDHAKQTPLAYFDVLHL